MDSDKCHNRGTIVCALTKLQAKISETSEKDILKSAVVCINTQKCVFQDCGGLLFRLHLHIQKLRNMTGVISETTEKIILHRKVTKQADIFA